MVGLGIVPLEFKQMETGTVSDAIMQVMIKATVAGMKVVRQGGSAALSAPSR